MLGRHSCALYIVMRIDFQKRLQAPKGRHLEPPTCGGYRRRSRGGGFRKRPPENGSRLPEAALEPLMCRAFILESLVASCVWICLVRLPGAAQEAANAWRLPEPSQRCSSRNMTPGGGPRSQGVVPPTSLVQCWF